MAIHAPKRYERQHSPLFDLSSFNNTLRIAHHHTHSDRRAAAFVGARCTRLQVQVHSPGPFAVFQLAAESALPWAFPNKR
jgi:hypothetical protein